jgi:NADPH:quinone reductase-like Zn-dependent oxidoreductase
VNPTDTGIRNGARAEALHHDPPPYVPGMDVAGTVAALGEGTDDAGLAVGDRVMGIVVPSGSHAGYSSLVALPVGSVVPAPAGTTHAQAATLPMNGLTARRALDLLDLPAGATLAVTGAARAFGGYVVQLAHAHGLRVVADAGSTGSPVFVREYAENRAALDRLREQAEKGEVTLRVADEIPAERAAEAHARFEAGGVRGRLVLVF